MENWKNILYKSFITNTALIDLYKAFDCIPHGALVAALHVYGISLNVAAFTYLYFKRQKQNLKIHAVISSFQTLLSEAPQGKVH